MDNKFEKLEKKIRSFKCYLFANHPFWGTIAANLKFSISTDLPSLAATDCAYEIVVSPECEKLSPEEFKFVIMHELLHAVFLHSQRRGRRNPSLWNIACDYAVNSILIDEMGLSMPKTTPGLYDEKFARKSAEEIYAVLYEEIKNKFQPIYIVSNDGQVIEVSLAGTRKITDETEKKKILGNSEVVVIDIRATSDLRIPKGITIEDQISRMKDIIAQAHIMHVKHGDKSRGTLPGSVAEYVKRIVEPEVPFDKLILRYASEIIGGKSEYSYTPIHKRHYLEFGAVMPSISKEEIPKVVVTVDTSGSINTEDLELFAGAIKKMSTLTPEITVITCDCEVHQVIKPNELESFLKSLVFRGRGGTSHIPVFKYIDEKIKNPDVVICLTDGYSEYPRKKPGYPVIWVLTPDHQTPPWGQKVVINRRKTTTIEV